MQRWSDTSAEPATMPNGKIIAPPHSGHVWRDDSPQTDHELLPEPCRRAECHQCSTARPAEPRRVPRAGDVPTSVLKVSNLVDTMRCAPGMSRPRPPAPV